MSVDPTQAQDPHSAFHDTCNALSEPIGEATGAIYGYGAGTLGGGPTAEQAVEQLVGGFVTDGWHSVCDTAEAVGQGAPVAWNELKQEAAEFSQSIADGTTTAFGELRQEATELGQSAAETSGDWLNSAMDKFSELFGGTPAAEPAPADESSAGQDNWLDGAMDKFSELFGGNPVTEQEPTQASASGSADGGWSLWGSEEKPNTTGDSPLESESTADSGPSWGGDDSSADSSSGSSDSGSSSGWGSGDSGDSSPATSSSSDDS